MLVSVTLPLVYLTQFFYVTFLSILLLHRGFRDDEKCKAKYGVYWDEYRALVPWKVLPGVY